MAIKRITTNLIKDSDIATVDIANNAITAAKITDGNITTAKLADLSVTAGKLAGTLDLTGKTITVATATTGDSDTSPASTAFVQQEIAALVDSSPSSLNTLNELAAALGDDASFSTTVTNSIATKLPLTGGTLTGALVVTADANPALEISRGSANTTNVNLKYNTTLTGQLSAANEKFQISAAGSGTEMEFYVNGAKRLEIGTSGNVGIGTTPSVHYTGYEALDIGNTLSLMSNNTSTNISTLTNNGYLNSNASNWVRKVQDESTMYEQVSGQHRFKSAGSDSAGSAITWLERMRIDSSGNVGIGLSNPSEKLEISGKIKLGGMRLASNDSGRIGLNRNPDDGSTVISGLQRFQINGPYSGGDYLDFQSYNSSGTYTGSFYFNAGKVGIGTNSPSQAFEVHPNDDYQAVIGRARIGDLGYDDFAGFGHFDTGTDYAILQHYTGQTFINASSGYPINFRINNATKMVVASSGNIGIGTTNPQNTLHIYGTGQTTANLAESGNQGGMLRITDANTGAGAGGAILFANYHADNNSSMGMAAIKGILNNGSTYTQGSIAFSTRNSINGTSMTERMRILYNGNVGIGDDNSDAKLSVIASSVSGGIVKIRDTDGTVGLGNTILGLYFSNDDDCSTATFLGMYDSGSRIGSITVTNATSTSFNTTSDYRLKENVTYDFNALDRVAQLKPARFNWIKDKTNSTVDGFLAHEVSDVVPEAIHGEKDAMMDEEYEVTPAVLDDDGNIVTEAEMGIRQVPDYQGIDQSKLVPLLTKAIQELKTELDAAKARLDEAGL